MAKQLKPRLEHVKIVVVVFDVEHFGHSAPSSFDDLAGAASRGGSRNAYGTLGCEWTCYSLIFAARMTLPHFSFSAAMNFPNSAGEVAKTVSPQSTIVCLILGSARPALIALLSTSMLAGGVSFGAVTPNQPTAS